jgi:hypothetical protein
MQDESKENKEDNSYREEDHWEDKDSVIYTTKNGKICIVNTDFSSSRVICEIGNS